MNRLNCRYRLLLVIVFWPVVLLGDVDPEWLRAWNEAWSLKPESLSSKGRIGREDEPGTPLKILGQVIAPDNSQAASVLVHAYQRDDAGLEFGRDDRETSTWRLQGWATTDAEGRFEFDTIRPAPDVYGREAAHIHFTLVSERHGRQWAPKVWFADDPMAPARKHRASAEARESTAVPEVIVSSQRQTISITLRLKSNADF